jgi:hypothetical protein
MKQFVLYRQPQSLLLICRREIPHPDNAIIRNASPRELWRRRLEKIIANRDREFFNAFCKILIAEKSAFNVVLMLVG